MSYGFKVLVEGDYACFTRPELKVERVSYDVPTPGALEGMLKSVYWKPAVRYVIDKIIVFHPIDFINIRRNEVKEKVKFKAVKNQMKGKAESPCIYTSKIRSQRAFIKRRLEKGQCFRTPCLGCSEFPIKSISLLEKFDENMISEEIIAMGDVDLGFMSYKVQFEDGGKPINGDWDNPKFSDKASTLYYRPHMVNGVIDVEKYREGLKC